MITLTIHNGKEIWKSTVGEDVSFYSIWKLKKELSAQEILDDVQQMKGGNKHNGR